MPTQLQAIRRPDSSTTLEHLVETLLRRAGVEGVIPTPIDELIAASKLEQAEDLEPFVGRFLRHLAKSARAPFVAALQKVRGIADLRERAIYIPSGNTNDRRRRFVQAHELGHQVIDWHSVNIGYRDDDMSLRLVDDMQELFDLEANCFAGDVLFQGRRFRERARSYAASFEAVFQLADDHCASRHATLWRLIEEQDESVSVALYWPNNYTVDASGYAVLRRGKLVASPKFLNKFSNIELPLTLPSNHAWLEARNEDAPCGGSIHLMCDGTAEHFEWQAWWNTYSLFVMLRRRPALSLVGSSIRGLRSK
jgi:hypothetical protein